MEQIRGVAFTPTPYCILFTFLGDVPESALLKHFSLCAVDLKAES
jgi:hypothetical protein